MEDVVVSIGTAKTQVVPKSGILPFQRRDVFSDVSHKPQLADHDHFAG